MKKQECELTYCASFHLDKRFIPVNEIIDDGAWRIIICKTCASVLNLKREQDIVDGWISNKKLRSYRKTHPPTPTIP